MLPVRLRFFPYRLERRAQPSALLSAVAPLFALAITVALGALLFLVIGIPPGAALYAYFVQPLSEVWSLHELAVKASPLILIALGLSLCFRSNNWNIGAEGQFILGAVAGSAIPVLYPDWTGFSVLPAMLLAGIAGGALYAAIPALLKTRFGANEILVSLMLVYVAELLLDWLVRGPWRDPQAFNFPVSVSFKNWQIVPEIVASGRAHYGLLVALLAAVVCWIVLDRTLKGFEIDIVGRSKRAGRFAGFAPTRTTFTVFMTSGALAGLAGIIEVSGAIGQLRPSISPGYGFTAIIVAFLGRLHPLGIVIAGTVLALSYLGGENAQVVLGLSDKVATVFQGLLLFAVLACDTFVRYRLRRVQGVIAMGERQPI